MFTLAVNGSPVRTLFRPFPGIPSEQYALKTPLILLSSIDELKMYSKQRRIQKLL